MTDKDLSELNSAEIKNLKIEFAPGAFDGFEGTQEELDEMIAEIKAAILDGSFLEKSKPIDIDELLDSDDPDDHYLAQKLLDSLEKNDRKLN